MKRLFLLVFSTGIAVGCGSTGGVQVAHDAFAAGGAAEFSAGPWRGALTSALIAFGPVYFCASSAGSAELCPTAVAEIAAVALVDGIDAKAQVLPPVRGIAGETIRSAAFDYGINWFRSQSSPTPAPIAPGGHSARFEGWAEKDGARLRFVADVDVPPPQPGILAALARPPEAQLTTEPQRLTIRFDPAAAVADVDFEELRAAGGDPVVVTKAMRAHNALVQRMVTTATPQFDWSRP